MYCVLYAIPSQSNSFACVNQLNEHQLHEQCYLFIAAHLLRFSRCPSLFIADHLRRSACSVFSYHSNRSNITIANDTHCMRHNLKMIVNSLGTISAMMTFVSCQTFFIVYIHFSSITICSYGKNFYLKKNSSHISAK